MSHSNYFAIAVLIGLATTFTSCSHDEIYSSSEKSKVSLTLHHFGIENAPFTRASETQAPHRIVFMAFDSSGKAVYDSTQVSSQEGFGSLSFELSPGAYTFVAVAHDVSKAISDPAVAASITSNSLATMPEALVQDAFSKTMNVTIKSGESFSADMSLPRIISSFDIYLNDKVPEGTKMFKIIANTSGSATSGNASFNPSTGLATTDRQYVKEVNITAGIGRNNNHIDLNLFLNANEQTIDITATAYNVDGQVIASHTLENVPMKRNRKTIAKGNFFTEKGSGSITFSTNWDTEFEAKY
ncbi:MAG: FimB/Mfa2 family fimbrial subunit [Prevotellaceae bacterium]|nr:FimB/Mfa2 family fimbrial subunit [Prevotellaceae bacterium]